MRFEKAPRLRSFFKRYTFADMEDKIQTLVHNDLTELIASYSGLAPVGQVIANGYLRDWKCYAEIRSLTEQAFPNLPEFATDSERLSATLNVEWGSPRFHCCIWSTDKATPSNVPSNGDWILEGKFSLYKAFGYPYRIYYPFDLLTNNIAREFGTGVRFGFSIENVGHGYPITSGVAANQDIITFSGNWTQELVVISPEPSPVIVNVSGGGSPSPTPTPTQNPPTVALTPPSGATGSIFTFNNQNLSIAITGLVANSSFTLQWLNGTTVVSTQTLNSDANGAYNAVFATGQMNAAPFTGNGSYKIKATQNGVSGESAALSIVTMRVELVPMPTTTNPSSAFQARMYGIPQSTMFYYQWMKNNVAISGTTNFNFGIADPNYQYHNYQTSEFTGAAYGTGASNVYKFRIYNSNNNVSAFSPEFTVT